MPSHDLIVIGTSAGGVEALTVLVGNLPRQLPAPICIVLHLPPVSPSALAEILSRAGPLPATRGVDGEAITPGHIYVAPPDHHLLVEPGRIRVTRGPKENRFRPAIDASFRSAAYAYGARVIMTDKLASYGAATREILPSVEHRQHCYLNNRAENSHQSTWERERMMQRFKSPGYAQRCLAAYSPLPSHFRPRRYLFSAPEYRQEMTQRFQTWREITSTAMAT